MRDHSRMSASDHLGQIRRDGFPAASRYSTQQLQQMAFRVTPKHEWHNWAATSADAEDHDPGTLRSLLHEQRMSTASARLTWTPCGHNDNPVKIDYKHAAR